jgi:hypothetical protein
MVLGNITELRNLPQLILTSPVAVVADSQIAEITGSIANSTVTVVTIQCTMESAGKYYLVDENDYRHYLTNPKEDYPAKLQLLSTYFLEKDQVVSLKFSASTTMTNLMVTMGAGIY